MTHTNVPQTSTAAPRAVTEVVLDVVPASTARTTSTPAAHKKVRTITDTRFEQALHIGRYASERVNGRDATVRRGFVRAEDPTVQPPLSSLLAGGQGGEVRLKLYLSMLFIAVASPYSTEFPARAWAEMFDLDDPSGAGTRRIRDALKWLEQHRLIRVERQPGRESEVFLLSDRGTGDPFELVSKDVGDIWIKSHRLCGPRDGSRFFRGAPSRHW